MLEPLKESSPCPQGSPPVTTNSTNKYPNVKQLSWAINYTNTDQGETTRLGENWEWTTNVWIKREGNFTISDHDTLDEIAIFQGEENTLVMMQSYTHEFQCFYRLQHYPFDTQVTDTHDMSELYFPGMFH